MELNCFLSFVLRHLSSGTHRRNQKTYKPNSTYFICQERHQNHINTGNNNNSNSNNNVFIHRIKVHIRCYIPDDQRSNLPETPSYRYQKRIDMTLRSKFQIYRGYYTAARRYEFYFRVVKTIFYERAQTSEYCFLPRENKIHIFKPPCNFLFIIWVLEYFCTNSSVRARNDVIDILTSEDMENTPLESRM